MTTYVVWDYWRSGNIYYAIYENGNYLYYSEAGIKEVDKVVELLKKKPKNIFSKDWLNKLFKRKGKNG